MEKNTKTEFLFSKQYILETFGRSQTMPEMCSKFGKCLNVKENPNEIYEF